MEYHFQASGIWKGIGISLVDVYKRVGKCFLLVCKKAQKGLKKHFMALKKLWFYSYIKDSAFTAVKMDAMF